MNDDFRISPADSERPGYDDGEHCSVSFVVPAFQAAHTLPASIASIRAAAPPDAEVVIVDDGSLDDTLALARQLGDVVLSQPCQGGAARSRNEGARVARGDILFFVDADVTVDTAAVAGALRRLDDGADAVFGAYEPLPPPEIRNAATTYKNLLHHYTHMRAAGPAKTFWSGFGAVRRAAFFAVRGFDPAVTTGADIEDIHLGYRLRAAGFEIQLDPTLQVRHHKQYTVRSVVASDVFHRAIPWTRAMLQLRTFSRDLNLRRESMLAGAVSLAIPLCLVATVWFGLPALLVALALIAGWLALNGGFLAYAARTWSRRGALASAALLYLYYLYGLLGTALGTGAYLLRRHPRSVLNSLRLDRVGRGNAEFDVSVAVIVGPEESLAALSALPPLEPWWELIVVSSTPLLDLPAGARFLPAPPGAPRSEMRHLALNASGGEMFATIDSRCAPVPGWLERVRAAATGTCLAVAGPFEHDRRSLRNRASQVVQYWQWRPERPPSWVVHHPASNAAFRADVARHLGGFQVEGALILRMAGFGARPVRFDPEMGVRLAGYVALRRFFRGVAGVARLRSSATVRYFDIGVPHRLVLVALSPLTGLFDLTGIVRQAVRERSADWTFWLALPIIAIGRASHWIGRDGGLLSPRLRGGLLPRACDDFAALEHEAELVVSRR